MTQDRQALDFDGVDEALGHHDGRRALTLLRPTLWRLETFDEEAHFKAVFSRLAKAGGLLVNPSFAGVIEAALKDLNNTATLFDCGFTLFEYGLYDGAAAVLFRANCLYPNQEKLLGELIAALEECGRFELARRLLGEASELLEKSFLIRYLLAFNTAMSGDLAGALALIGSLAPRDERERFMAGRIERMTTRGAALEAACGLCERDLRGWHFVTTGGLLLHTSPYGDEGMNGRYAFIQDSTGMIKAGLELLARVLERLESTPRRLLYCEDRSSRLLAQAAGRITGLPVEPRDGADGLLLVYDLNELEAELLNVLVKPRLGELIFAHRTCWTERPPFTPDFTTYLYQISKSPFDRPIPVRSSAAPQPELDLQQPDQVLVEAIVEWTDDKESGRQLERDWHGLEELLAAVGQDLQPHLEPVRRSPLWYMGPVTSSRFW